MGYICDLTNVMRGIFYRLQRVAGDSMTSLKEVSEETVDTYYKWDSRLTVIREVASFTMNKSVFEAANKDHALRKLIELIEKYQFTG